MPAEKKRGERKMQILQVIAEMLQDPKGDRKSTRLNSSHVKRSRMPSSA